MHRTAVQASRVGVFQPHHLTIVALALLAVLPGCRRSRGKHGKAAATVAEPAPSAADPAALILAAALSLPQHARDLPKQETPQAGGVLKVHLDVEPPHLNPLVDNNQMVSRVTEGLIYEPLIECDGQSVQPRLAEAWGFSPDGLRLSLRLRPDVVWHDGSPVTPLDVQASFEPLLRNTSRQPLFRNWLMDVEAVEIAPGRTVRFRLLRPSQQALYALCEIPILPAALERGTAIEKAQLARQPMGTGPFKFDVWDRGHRIKLVRNDAYAGPAPHLEQIWFEIEGDGARAITRTKRGQIDILPQVLPVHFPDQLSPLALGRQVDVYRLTPLRFAFVAINTRKDPLSDTRFRWALSRLWQRDRLATELHRGLARPLGGPPVGDRPSTPFDREQAKLALDEAGYRDLNADGVRDKGASPVRLTFLHVAGSKLVAKEAHQFALELRRAGVLLDLVAVDQQTLLTRLKEGHFDLAPLLWEGSVDEDPRALFGPEGIFNYGGYQSPQLEALLAEWVQAPSIASRRDLAARIGDLLAAENPALFLYRFDTLALVNQRVRGLVAEGERFDFRNVWLSEGRDVPEAAP